MAIVVDPVRGMKIESAQAEAQSKFQGEDFFFFCSVECKRLFDADPRMYLKVRQAAGARM